MKQNRNLLIIALIAVVNALGYGIIIPLLYSYSKQYGLNYFENGLLFAVFSICQFISTPIIGRLSDKYGRRPLLISSIAGTALSFFMTAFAPNVFFLFIARALDGITAGNIPVAMAVISDTTDEKTRAKGFGIIGAGFGVGFLFGPAISAFTVGFGSHVPFIIAGTVSLIAVVLTTILLPETNKHIGEVHKGKLFDLKKLYHALFDPNVGVTLLITLFFSLAFTMFISTFQPYASDVFKMTAKDISFIFTIFGVIGLTQIFLGQFLSSKFGIKRTFSAAIAVVAFSFFLMFIASAISIWLLIIACIILGLANSVFQPLTPAILSQETDAKSQGSLMGINASYMSIGQIIGPLIGGSLGSISLSYPFLAASLCALICFTLSFHILKPGVKKESAF